MGGGRGGVWSGAVGPVGVGQARPGVRLGPLALCIWAAVPRHSCPRPQKWPVAAGCSLPASTIAPAAMALAGLLAACVVMFGAAFGTGCAAIGGVAAAVADEAALGVLSAFGAGLLCSTALSIVIPEGFHALADSHHAHSALPSWAPGAALAAGFFVMQILDLGASCDHGCGRDAPPPTSPLAPSPLPRWAPSPAPFHTPTANPLLLLTGRDAASSALTAMVVHAAADGLAVGAACAGGSAAAELLVLVAMVVHKARGSVCVRSKPSAPGFTL